MAAQTEPDGDRIVGEVVKNAREVIRVAHSEFNGRALIDARVWLPGALPTLPATPTRKGLSLPPATWRKLMPLIERALHEFDGDGGEEDDG